MGGERFYSVKEIADIVGVSRQTLIYYDSIDLFKPEFVDSNGYRKYSTKQIMELREILFFKNNNIPLDFIKQNLRERDVDQIKSGLKQSREKLLQDIEDLTKKVSQLSNRIRGLERASVERYTVSIPLIKYFPERIIFWLPWTDTENIEKSMLYQTFMEARGCVESIGLTDDLGWGGIIRMDEFYKADWLKKGGSFVYIPADYKGALNRYGQNIEYLPAGEYLCMNKYGMPYERGPIEELLTWAKNQDVQIIGDLIDECLLDTSYLSADKEVGDFSQLQVRIKR